MLKLCVFSIILISTMAFADRYRVGEKWNKVYIKEAPSALHSLAPSVGEIGSSATLFYIGTVKGRHYAITNSHVCPNEEKCLKRRVEFFYHKNVKGQSLKGIVRNVPVIKTQLDLALIEIQFLNAETFSHFPKPLILSKQLPKHNQPLVSLGYGVHHNEYGTLMAEAGGDCRVFSYSSDIRKVKDPDSINPYPFSVYSFLMGCDVSHGDSGSPILDLKTLHVIGLLWTGRTPKHPLISRKGFENLDYSFLWQQLNYATPSAYIYKVLSDYFNNSQI